MRKYIRGLVFASAFLGMGISMPSCPGQQAMQQQIDTLQTANADLTKKVNSMSAKLESTNAEIVQIKQLLPSVANVVQTHADTIKNLNTAVTELQGKVAKIPVPTQKKRGK